MCEGCCEWDSHYEPKDEVTISKMEQVEDEPTEITYQNCSDALLKMWMDNVLTDAEFNRIIDKLNNAQHEDEPQTCDTCKYGEDKHRYTHICNECGVGINNYEPKDRKE